MHDRAAKATESIAREEVGREREKIVNVAHAKHITSANFSQPTGTTIAADTNPQLPIKAASSTSLYRFAPYWESLRLYRKLTQD
jgi:hypothetical protein